jgi:hypothetical protein
MAYFRDPFHRGLAVCLLILAAFGGVFALALLATAAAGNSPPSSILLAGFGFILLVFSALVLVFAIRKWTPTKPRRNI